jgi:ParB-like chromosome segregation protein Spo0J
VSVDTLFVRPIAGPVPADPTAAPDWQPPVLSPVQVLPIAALRPPADPPRQGGESDEHVQLLADCGGVLPPITVHSDTMRIIDGVHRVKAALLRGETVIPVRFFTGGEADAFVLAVEANTTHGRPLAAADRATAAARILRSHPHWSDRAVSAVAGLSPKTIAALRRSAVGKLPSAQLRVGRDGRVRPLDATAGRIRASELIAEKPQASLREIAKEAGISPGTVRDVRDRLQRGESPVPSRRRTVGCSGQPDAAVEGDRPARTRRPEQRRTLTDHTRVLAALAKDPTLRYSENGRVLLRLLSTHMIPDRRRGELARSVPRHCAAAVSAVARECAGAWELLADELELAAMADSHDETAQEDRPEPALCD